MDRDFQRKRVRTSNSKSRVPVKTQRIGNQEIGNSALSTGGESGEQEQEQDQNGVEEEEDVGVNGINSNLVVEDSDPSSPYPSFDDDDNGNQLSEDHHNAGGNQVRNQRELRNNRHSNRMGRGIIAQERDEDSSGVRMWLNDLGLRKYAPLFDIHGVDDEVLPLLTLEDLKDMGINEVGVRRKLYSSIQKLERLFPARNTCPLCRYELPTDDKEISEIHEHELNDDDSSLDEEEASQIDYDGREGREGAPRNRWFFLAAPIVSIVGLSLILWFGDSSAARLCLTGRTPCRRENNQRRWWSSFL